MNGLHTHYCSCCGSDNTSTMAWVNNKTGEIEEYIGCNSDVSFNYCNDGCGNVGLKTLPQLWEDYQRIPIVDGALQQEFLGFEKGACCLDVLRWFEERCPHSVEQDLINE